MLPIEKVPKMVNARGEYFHLDDAITSLKVFYFEWERKIDVTVGSAFMKANNWIPVVCVTLYCVLMVWGIPFMKDRKPFDLRWSLAAWNLFLSAFSFIGMVRTWPHVAYNLWSLGWEATLCKPAINTYGCGATGLWVQLFIISKIPELFDTFFIVARKKNLVFLHWYHHITVLLFCWHSYVTESTVGIYFAAMNYAVHALMYFYYFLMAIRWLPKWFPAGIVTICQISQMVVGVVLTIINGRLYVSSKLCDVKLENLIAGGLMYFSYFLLFLHFAFGRYVLKPKSKKSNGAVEEKKVILAASGSKTVQGTRTSTPRGGRSAPEEKKVK